MDLLEYQAKELFREVGIPVLPSQRIDRIEELKDLQIPYPVVLKSQVYAGGRGKAGGIKFAANTIDAVAAAQSILHLSIKGEYPRILLAESKYEPDREFYLAVTIDRSAARPLLLGSQQGGMAVESNPACLQRVVVDREFSPFYARRLAIQMGLKGELIQSVSAIVQKMYELFVQKDLDLVEINPLAVSATSELMALDGKITANDAALGRHPELLALKDQFPNSTDALAEVEAVVNRSWVDFEHEEGTIAVLCTGAGLTMATLDLLCQAKGKPAKFLNLAGDCRYHCSPSQLQDQIQQSLEQLSSLRKIKVVLINFLGCRLSGQQLGEAIASYLKRQSSYSGQRAMSLVIRLVGTQLQDARAVLEPLGDDKLVLLESLDDAIEKAILLSDSVELQD